LFFISTTTVFAEESILSIQTDDNFYDEGDTIAISGNVNIVIGKTPVLIQIIHEESKSIIEIAQITIAQDGSFTKTVLAEKPAWKNEGEYIVKAFYQDQVVEIEFSYSPKTEIPETKTTFEVDAGSHGTFDVDYSIKGGTVKDMVVDPDIFAIIVQIESPDEGTITLDLPREFIGAEKQDGKDDTFIILIDGIEVPYQESLVHPDSRVITINFEEGDSDIEIIGTYVVPEFGTIVMMILIVGIITVILATRNKFQIKI
jgi:predicted secreted protein with PEFG-CTERM motif